jgi:hypothetical protein
MQHNPMLLDQLREIIDPQFPPRTRDDVEANLKLLVKFINARYVPRATYDKKVNGIRHKALNHRKEKDE